MVRDISEIASSMIPSGNKRLRVLDLGSYIGLDAEKICDYLIEMGYEIDLYLVDILDDALGQARNRFANRKGINSVTTLRRDFSQQGWEEGLPNDFDMAFSSLSTAGIPDKKSFYQSVYRLLKPKSPLVMGVSVYLSDEAKRTEANALFEDECRKKMEAALGRDIPDSEILSNIGQVVWSRLVWRPTKSTSYFRAEAKMVERSWF